MKRSMIAVCLLLLSPSSVIACVEDHNPGVGWADQRPMRWSIYGNGAESMGSDRLVDVSLVAGVSGAVILLGVVVRAIVRSARYAAASPVQAEEETPLALPFDGPACEPSLALPEPDIEAMGASSWDLGDVSAASAPWGAVMVESPCCSF